jgi:hypothetical protein
MVISFMFLTFALSRSQRKWIGQYLRARVPPFLHSLTQIDLLVKNKKRQTIGSFGDMDGIAGSSHG